MARYNIMCWNLVGIRVVIKQSYQSNEPIDWQTVVYILMFQSYQMFTSCVCD